MFAFISISSAKFILSFKIISLEQIYKARIELIVSVFYENPILCLVDVTSLLEVNFLQIKIKKSCDNSNRFILK